LIIFQPYGEDSSTVILIGYLLLGFSGFFMLILLLSMVFVTLAQEDQILLINTEDKDIDNGNHFNNSEVKNDIEDGEINIKVLKQTEKSPNKFLLKTQQVKEEMMYFLHRLVNFPLSIYYYCVHWKQEIENDFIIVK
jgi:hypothetical protein